MKHSAALFAFFAFLAFVTSIPLLDTINDDYVVVSVAVKKLDEHSVDKRQISDEMSNIVIAINVFVDEFNSYRGYSRSDFTANVVGALYNRNPHFNYIICHPDHDYDFGSPWGVNVYDVHVTYNDNTIFTSNVGYDVVIGKNGTFTRYVDGGFVNWAYIGNVISRQELNNEAIVTFGMPD